MSWYMFLISFVIPQDYTTRAVLDWSRLFLIHKRELAYKVTVVIDIKFAGVFLSMHAWLRQINMSFIIPYAPFAADYLTH